MAKETIQELMAIYPDTGRLPCAVAHYLAAYAGISPLEVGKAATQAGIKLDQCQLGLFGYGRKGKSDYKIMGRKVEVGSEVLDLISAAAKEGRSPAQGSGR
jgi:hypothetical protein